MCKRHSRTFEHMDGDGHVANGPHNIYEGVAAAKEGAIPKSLVDCSDHSRRIQHETHASTSSSWTSAPNSRGMWFHAAGDRESSRKFLFPEHDHRERKFFLVLRTRSRILRSERGEVQSKALALFIFEHRVAFLFSSTQRLKLAFRFFVAAIYSQY